jgi:hypothetical protein
MKTKEDDQNIDSTLKYLSSFIGNVLEEGDLQI